MLYGFKGRKIVGFDLKFFENLKKKEFVDYF